MNRRMQALTRASRWLRYGGAALSLAAGVFYVCFPPRSTIGLYEAAWPSVMWGVAMAVAGATIFAGIRSRILQVEQLGMLLLAISTGLLATNQTLIMTGDDITWTRGGGTILYWCLTVFATARYTELGADIRSARLAQLRVDG